MNSFIEREEIYPERQSDGHIVKRIEFRFPVYFKGSEISGLRRDETDMSKTVIRFPGSPPGISRLIPERIPCARAFSSRLRTQRPGAVFP